MLPPVLVLSGLLPPAERAAILIRAAELMENQMQTLMGILVREAGKTFSNAIAEVREAVDFFALLRRYSQDNFATIAIARSARLFVSVRGTSHWQSLPVRLPPR